MSKNEMIDKKTENSNIISGERLLIPWGNLGQLYHRTDLAGAYESE